MEEILILTESQANSIRGKYGSYSAIEPISLPDGTYFIPKDCLNAPDLASIRSTLRTMTGNTQTVERLPDVGGQCISGHTYQYGDGVISGYSGFFICDVTHIRSNNSPWEIPDYFTFGRPNSDTLEWIPNEYVYVNWIRVFYNIS